MELFTRLFSQNRSWAEKATAADSECFSRLSHQQNPDYLWIGCSDSRVPASQVVGLGPGEAFVHRNIANVVDPADPSCGSVIQYAVDHLHVKHILVVGHYGCGGVKAALDEPTLGAPLDAWLSGVRQVKQRHHECLRVLPDESAQHARLCELNVIEQVRNVCSSATVQAAWRRGQPLFVHGCIYALHNGNLQDLKVSIQQADDVDPVCAAAIAQLNNEAD
jgi:carbonic anhydrase